MSDQEKPRLAGGIHRDITGRDGDPLRFFIAIDRRLASGRLDSVELTEDQIVGLVRDAADALRMLLKDRSR